MCFASKRNNYLIFPQMQSGRDDDDETMLLYCLPLCVCKSPCISLIRLHEITPRHILGNWQHSLFSSYERANTQFRSSALYLGIHISFILTFSPYCPCWLLYFSSFLCITTSPCFFQCYPILRVRSLLALVFWNSWIILIKKFLCPKVRLRKTPNRNLKPAYSKSRRVLKPQKASSAVRRH